MLRYLSAIIICSEESLYRKRSRSSFEVAIRINSKFGLLNTEKAFLFLFFYRVGGSGFKIACRLIVVWLVECGFIAIL